MVERNDPCWCGSGKKYKKCHYLIDPLPYSNMVDNSFRQQLRVAEAELQVAMLDFYKERWGGELTTDIWNAFFTVDSDEADPIPAFDETEFDSIACYWFYTPYSPEGNEGNSLARMYLNVHKDDLPELKIRILEGIDAQPFSLFQVRDVEPGVSLTLRDLLLDEEVVVKDTQASHPGIKGRILFTRPLTIDGTSIMMGCGPYSFESTWISNVQDLRRWLSSRGKLDKEMLRNHESDLRNFYKKFRNMHLNPKPPMMCNTDGDRLEFQTLRWELINTIDEAVDALLPLTLETKQEVMATAKKSKNEVKWVEMRWAKEGNKGMGSTLLGRLIIEPDGITAEVNSQKRATKIRKEIEKRLGAGAIFETATIESYEAKMREFQTKVSSGPEAPMDPAEEAAVEDALVEMQRKHWESWTNEALPALGGLTPQKAVQVKEGREMVEALLFEFEQGNSRASRPSLMVPVDDLRKRLKL